jgi:CRISPR-associated endonuclease Cas3-HD
MYSAHSPDPKKGVDLQLYEAHINGVLNRAEAAAQEVCKYAKHNTELFLQTVKAAAIFHDLGKLDKANQKILTGEKSAQKLAINHVDAGAAHFLTEKNFCSLVAAVIHSHHRGYPDFIDEQKKNEFMFRDITIREHVDESLPELLKIHKALVKDQKFAANENVKGNQTLFLRLVLSCLADADHTDTAVHYKDHMEPPAQIPLQPEKRLKTLEKYVKQLSVKGNSRSALREEMYYACKEANTDTWITSCDSPVGSGKTTAIMAHMLKQAVNRKLRRIIVVLPFTNIIKQSVEIYRKALCHDGENPKEVVAELHHRAEFQDKECRYLTALWRAPIIVTTAVTFFETLASNSPATLRRLHALPGSALFIDESHAALPVKLLPLAWHWINLYAAEWNCYWVLASGSLNKFWEIEEINRGINNNVPELVSHDLRTSLLKYEKGRVSYRYEKTPKNAEELIMWINKFSGPRLLIVNTVQSAAVIADQYAKKYGRDKVEHLSTALTPEDRDKTINRIKERLADTSDTDWTLVATSCVEAGVNFSFRNGFRELSSLVSLLQAAGRVNREGFYENSEVWTFKLVENELLKNNPELKESAKILEIFFKKKIPIDPELSTESIKEEITTDVVSSIYEKLVLAEQINRFPEVEKLFKVINTDTRLVLVDDELADKIKNHKKVDWLELQKKSVNILESKLKESRTSTIIPGVYHWNLKYDGFLGYMAGLLENKKFLMGEPCII